MNNLLKLCKVCKVEQQRQGDFSGQSALCCKCVYAKKKDYFIQYYKSNGEKKKQYENVKYEKANPKGLKRSLNKKSVNKLFLVFRNVFN